MVILTSLGSNCIPAQSRFLSFILIFLRPLTFLPNHQSILPFPAHRHHLSLGTSHLSILQFMIVAHLRRHGRQSTTICLRMRRHTTTHSFKCTHELKKFHICIKNDIYLLIHFTYTNTQIMLKLNHYLNRPTYLYLYIMFKYTLAHIIWKYYLNKYIP